MSSHIQTRTEVLILTTATKFHSPSVTVVDHLAEEIDSRNDPLAPGLNNALRDFRASRLDYSTPIGQPFI